MSTNQINLLVSRLAHTPVLSSIFEGYCYKKDFEFCFTVKTFSGDFVPCFQWVSADSAGVWIERVENYKLALDKNLSYLTPYV